MVIGNFVFRLRKPILQWRLLIQEADASGLKKLKQQIQAQSTMFARRHDRKNLLHQIELSKYNIKKNIKISIYYANLVLFVLKIITPS